MKNILVRPLHIQGYIPLSPSSLKSWLSSNSSMEQGQRENEHLFKCNFDDKMTTSQ